MKYKAILHFTSLIDDVISTFTIPDDGVPTKEFIDSLLNMVYSDHCAIAINCGSSIESIKLYFEDTPHILLGEKRYGLKSHLN